MEVHHEKQDRLFCGKHALNGVFGSAGVDLTTVEEMDEVAQQVRREEQEMTGDASWGPGWFTAHRWAGIGNYDVNVLMKVAERRGLAMEYVSGDFANVVQEMEAAPQTMVGLICNLPGKAFLGLVKTRHWFSIVHSRNGQFVNVDSKLEKPVYYESPSDCIKFLQGLSSLQLFVLKRK